MLNAKRFGLAAGALCGTAMLVTTLLSAYNGYASDFLGTMESVYPGYDISAAGSIIGFIYGFVSAGIGGWLFVSIYNRINK